MKADSREHIYIVSDVHERELCVAQCVAVVVSLVVLVVHCLVVEEVHLLGATAPFLPRPTWPTGLRPVRLLLQIPAKQNPPAPALRPQTLITRKFIVISLLSLLLTVLQTSPIRLGQLPFSSRVICE